MIDKLHLLQEIEFPCVNCKVHTSIIVMNFLSMTSKTPLSICHNIFPVYQNASYFVLTILAMYPVEK